MEDQRSFVSARKTDDTKLAEGYEQFFFSRSLAVIIPKKTHIHPDTLILTMLVLTMSDSLIILI